MAATILYATSYELGHLDRYTEAGWAFDSGWSVGSTAAKRHTSNGVGGTYYLESSTANNPVRTPTMPDTSGRWVHYYFKPGTGGTSTSLQFGLNGSRQLTVSFEAGGLIKLFRATTNIATSAAGAWNASVGHWVAVYLKAQTAGECEVWVDGVRVIDFSGDTAENASDHWNQVGFGTFFAVTTGVTNSFVGVTDDLIISDDDTGAMTSPFVECVCIVKVPDGVVSGNLTGVPTTGANRYQNIDEQPVDQADYNEAAAANDEDLYDFAAGTGTPDTVVCVAVTANAGRDGTITGAQVHVVSGASDTYGSTVTLPAAPGFGTFGRYFKQNPDGPADWNGTSLGALQAGAKFV